MPQRADGLPNKEWLDILTEVPHADSLTGFIKQNERACKCQIDWLLLVADDDFSSLPILKTSNSKIEKLGLETFCPGHLLSHLTILILTHCLLPNHT